MVYLKRLTKFILATLVLCTTGITSCTANETVPSPSGDKMNRCAELDDYKQSKEALLIGSTALSDGRYAEANKLFSEGIDVLGDSYRTPDTIDDTGMKLTLAGIEEKSGNLEVSANLKKGVLESRLNIYEKKESCKN